MKFFFGLVAKRGCEKSENFVLIGCRHKIGNASMSNGEISLNSIKLAQFQHV